MIGRHRLAAWFWLVPALFFLGVFLVYPVVETVRISFLDASSNGLVGLSNYIQIFTRGDTQSALLNNLLWLFLFSIVTTGLGLIAAVLADRVRYEVAVKTLIFVPMAISFVAAGVIWTFMYQFQPHQPGFTQTGTINALLVALGGEPVPWLVEQGVVPIFGINNPAIIVAGIWMWTGFAMVILSAGLKGIPVEVLEAARVDGASDWQIFWRILVPMIWPTMIVVAITLMINALKIFDLVFIMTGGRFGTDVIATRMWREMFISLHFGRAGALAVLLLIAIIPIMVFNIRRFRQEES
jgi:alpha-glucoside transport system permease protein